MREYESPHRNHAIHCRADRPSAPELRRCLTDQTPDSHADVVDLHHDTAGSSASAAAPPAASISTTTNMLLGSGAAWHDGELGSPDGSSAVAAATTAALCIAASAGR
jgi:hypothetical protein